MRPLRTSSSRAASLSIPTTRRPWSANESASGRPMRPRPTTATLSAMAGTLRRLPYALAQVLLGERGHEARVVVEVARQQPARLLRDAVDPLEAARLHPAR